MGYLKPSAKGLTSWQRGVWLGKTQSNDAHIISRVCSSQDLCVETQLHGFLQSLVSMSLGSKLMAPKCVLKPAPQITPALPPGSVQPEKSKPAAIL